MRNQPLVRDALRIIQDLVASASGAPLQGEAERRLESVLESLTAGEVAAGLGNSYSDRDVTILLADLRGFSAIAASYPAGVVLGVLNRCFSTMSDIVVRHYGTIDKFMGDAIMAIFSGDPRSPGDHARRAVMCAVEMQIAMNELRQRHADEKVPDMYLGIGINTGRVVAGLIGSDAYRAYTVIGEQVNLASRIEAFSLRGQVLMSEATYQHCGDLVATAAPIDVYVKGYAERVCIREVLGIPSLGQLIPRQELRKSPRVDVKLPFRYRLLDGKTVRSEAATGVVHDLGYYGMLAEIDRRLPLYTEVNLEFELLRVAYKATDIYGRVVKIAEQSGKFFAGIEFTSLSPESNSRIQLFVQMLIQRDAGAP